MIKGPPSNPRGFYEYCRGYTAFAAGQPRPAVDAFSDFGIYGFERRDGWDAAKRMAEIAANWEAQRATKH